jgi:hypothetical protein
MGSVAHIKNGGTELPYPLCAREGDVFKCFVFRDDIPYAFQAGGFVYVLLNHGFQSGYYLIKTPEGATFAHLMFSSDGLAIEVTSLHASYASHKSKSAEVDIIGKVVEAFPTGDLANRWILYESGLEFNPRFELPFLVSKPKR